MKKLMIFSLFSVILFTTSCAQQADVNAMLKNAETKDKVFSAIMDDHQLMTEFMNKMMTNEHAMMMMQGNKGMMGMMMQGGNMMQMMQGNPELVQNMISSMMKNGNMMAQMMQMMNQKGMISDECLQSGMQRMKDQGMPMNMNMGMMKPDEGVESHESQH